MSRITNYFALLGLIPTAIGVGCAANTSRNLKDDLLQESNKGGIFQKVDQVKEFSDDILRVPFLT